MATARKYSTLKAALAALTVAFKSAVNASQSIQIASACAILAQVTGKATTGVFGTFKKQYRDALKEANKSDATIGNYLSVYKNLLSAWHSKRKVASGKGDDKTTVTVTGQDVLKQWASGDVTTLSFRAVRSAFKTRTNSKSDDDFSWKDVVETITVATTKREIERAERAALASATAALRAIAVEAIANLKKNKKNAA